MDMGDYQRWVAEYDRQRGWHLVQQSQVLGHIVEEVGEMARECSHLEQYRPSADLNETKAKLALEMADVITLIVKLAALYEIDIDAALSRLQELLEDRFPVAEARYETVRYHQAQVGLIRQREARYLEWQQQINSGIAELAQHD